MSIQKKFQFWVFCVQTPWELITLQSGQVLRPHFMISVGFPKAETLTLRQLLPQGCLT